MKLLKRQFEGLNHNIELSAPLFKKNKDSEMELLLKKISELQKENKELKAALENSVEFEDVVDEDVVDEDGVKEEENVYEEGNEEEEENEEEESDILKKVIKNVKKEEEILDDKYNKLIDENLSLKNIVSTFTKEKTELKLIISEISEQVDNLSSIKEENKKLKNQINESIKNYNNLLDQNNSLQEKLNSRNTPQNSQSQSLKIKGLTNEILDLQKQHELDENHVKTMQKV